MGDPVVVPVPEGMEPYKEDMEYFVATMLRKLNANRHKGTGATVDLRMMLKEVREETVEAEQALRAEGQFEFGVECVDIANFAFLAARGAWSLTRREYDEYRAEE